mmetsp:Transcript_9909/g.21071  ORF Transcript_9909/g.21071 Transcript_9909/m.21071 type:complete len:138 (-) Transcript_9909:1134-1547(-)
MLQENCNVEFKAGPCRTTYANINCWFDNWEQFLLESGFGTIQENGKIDVPDEQRSCILNLDESALSLDGSTQKRGGCPTVTFYNGSLPVMGMKASKSSQCSTLFTGSTLLLVRFYLHIFNFRQGQNQMNASTSVLRQ